MKVTFLGCGNMGGAIAHAISSIHELTVFDTDDDKAKALASETGAAAASDIESAIRASECIILAVKPQVLPSLYPVLRKYGTKKFISIAAGVPLEVLEREIGTKDIVRFMPNIAAKAKSAVTAVAAGKKCDGEFLNEAFSVAASFGSAFILDESLFPAFIGISGSAIAYIFEFIHALALGGTDQGISYAESVRIATDTMASAVALMKDSGKSPAELMTMVCSAKGTTIKGMKALHDGNFDATVMEAVIKASEKSQELERTAKERK